MDAKTIILGISAVIALAAVRYNFTINRKKATVDLMLEQKRNPSLGKARMAVLNLNSKCSLTQYADNQYKGTEERDAILLVINNYEFIATGIREGAFDRNLYKRMNYSTVMHDWKALKPFVYEMRKIHDISTIFQEFEWLADKFRKRKLKADSPG